MTAAKIYQPTRNAMQSGKANTSHWLLEFSPETSRFNDPIMGWVGSSDMRQELRLYFPTKDQAIEYARENDIEYQVIEPQRAKLILKSYADNFKASQPS